MSDEFPAAVALRILCGLLVVALGVAAVIAGEGDDSPGLQLLGALLVLGTLVVGVRAVVRSR